MVLQTLGQLIRYKSIALFKNTIEVEVKTKGNVGSQSSRGGPGGHVGPR